MIQLPKSDRPKPLILDGGHWTAKTVEEASVIWSRKSQYELFKEEISQLEQRGSVLKSSRFSKLSTFLSEDGIIRIKGRFPELDLNLDFDVRYPIVLDPKHKYTQLLVDYYHQQAGHTGIETVVNNLRMKYWILHIRAAVKRSFFKCLSCKIRKCVPVVPEMGNLPRQRVEAFVFPFTYVGIDFFGPMHVSVGRRIEKRYGVLFTCLTVRAVHIELAATLDTSSTILAIRRFMCRRGRPKEIITDNGTNFVGAERELRECIKSMDQTRISDELSNKSVRWRFNPPSTPHMGGAWERMVRSVKTALKISLKSINPKEEVLLTLLHEVEYMVNSRPLTHISIDPIEPEAITPNHFLLLRPGGVVSNSNIDQVLTRKQWQIAETLANCYWKRWVREYRPTILQRAKWHTKCDPIRIGDITLIVDEKMPRNEWLLGRVEQVYPGKDGIIRVVQVKTTKGNYVRPVAKLCILPTSENS